MQRTEQLLRRVALGVEPVGDRQRVRIVLDDVVERRPLLIERVDARAVLFYQRPRRERSRGKSSLQVANGELVEGEGSPFAVILSEANGYPRRRVLAPLRRSQILRPLRASG